MDTAQWAQGNIGVVKVPMVELGSNPIPKPHHHHHHHHHHHVAPNNSNSNPNPNIGGGMQVERKARPQKDQALNCPRCNSSNTKFCYYNNYSLSQPRYFCKTCRRYWTEGGSLRNVPVGGGSRKNKRPSNSNHSSSSPNSTTSTSSLSNSNSNLSSSIMSPNSNSSSSPSKKLPEASHHHHHHHNPKTNNNIIHQPQDLNLAYPPPPHDQISSTCATRGFNLMSSLMPMSVSSSDHASLMYSNRSNNNSNNNNNSGGGGFIPLQEFKPLHQGLNFSFEGFENNTNGNGNGYVSGFQGIQLGDSGAARILFPIEDLKHLPTTTTTTTTTPTHEFEQHNHNHNQRGGSHGDSTGFWSGMLGGGSW